MRVNFRGMPKNMMSNKQMKKVGIDGRYFEGMLLVKWLDTKFVMMLLTIDLCNPDNVVSKTRRQKDRNSRAEVRVPAN